MKAHLLDPPYLSNFGPRERHVLARALMKDPAQRHPSCTAFVKALVEALLAEKTAAEPAKVRPPGKRPVPPSSQATPPPAAQRPSAPPPDPGREVVNSIKMRLVLIPAGTFTLGSPR